MHFKNVTIFDYNTMGINFHVKITRYTFKYFYDSVANKKNKIQQIYIL